MGGGALAQRGPEIDKFVAGSQVTTTGGGALAQRGPEIDKFVAGSQATTFCGLPSR